MFYIQAWRPEEAGDVEEVFAGLGFGCADGAEKYDF